jgi:hypothetical protein
VVTTSLRMVGRRTEYRQDRKSPAYSSSDLFGGYRSLYATVSVNRHRNTRRNDRVRILAMPHSFDVEAESPSSVQQILAAYASEEYWHARIAAGGPTATTTLDALDVAEDGTVTVSVTQHIGRQLLPKPARKFIGGDLKIVNRETWTPTEDGRARGQSNVSVPAGLGSGGAEAWMTPTQDGSLVRYVMRVEIKVPLVGRQFEKAIAGGLTKSVQAAHEFTDNWIAENG